jgi:Fanconi anemia group M protein
MTKTAPRAFQSAIADSAISRGNTLAVLPTGIGKTLIAILVIERMMGKGRVLFLAPTKPLCEQHAKTIEYELGLELESESLRLVTGAIGAKKRAELWNATICVSTPQTVRNDIEKGRMAINHSLCVFDEAHRAVGNYAYTGVAEACHKAGTMVLALTASPGGNRERIQEIVDALGVANIEIRTTEDEDVRPYVKRTDIKWLEVSLPKGHAEAVSMLRELVAQSALALREMGFFAPFNSKKHLVALRAKILATKSGVKYAALSQHATLFGLIHLLELLETQGTGAFLAYVKKMRGKETVTKAAKRILYDYRFAKILEMVSNSEEHPKLALLVSEIKKLPGKKIIVFAQYRDSVARIVEELSRNGISAKRFVGKKEGVTLAEQQETIGQFRRGDFQAMVASSIGEEGLDIPQVDTVFFFEPVPSEIRSIQRRGRTGRGEAGSVVVLFTKGTRDEAFLHASRRREQKMGAIVGRMQSQLSLQNLKNSQAEQNAPKTAPKKRTQSKISDFMRGG